MLLFDTLKTLPKEYLQLITLKLILVMVSTIAFLTLSMFVIVIYLYVNHYSMLTIILGGFSVWLIFLTLIAAMYFFKQYSYRNKIKILQVTFSQTFSSLNVFLLNKFLRSRKSKSTDKTMA